MGIRRVAVKPGVSSEEMRTIWDKAVSDAKSDARTIIALLFAPGDYPLPDPGPVLFKDIPTPLHVSRPGIEVRFSLNSKTARLQIVAARPDQFEDK